MNKYVKGIVIYAAGVTGGIVIGGIAVTGLALKSDNIRDAIKQDIYDKLTESLYCKKPFYNRDVKTRDADRYIFETDTEAKKVLNNMKDIIYEYGKVTISDYYDLVGKTACYTDHKYGWTNLDKVTVRYCKHGYYIDLPPAKPVE